MVDTATTVAIIGAAATVVAAIGVAVIEGAFRKSKKARHLVVAGPGSAGVATSSRGGKSVATSSSGGSNVTLVDSPGATVVVPPAPHPGSAPRNASDDRVFIREESPEEILKVLSVAPPLERRDLARRAYVGRWARWAGEVFDVSHDVERVREAAGGWVEKKVGYHVLVKPAPLMTCFAVNLPESERAAVELLREGDIVEIEGRLDRADDLMFSLGDGRIISHTKKQKPSGLK